MRVASSCTSRRRETHIAAINSTYVVRFSSKITNNGGTNGRHTTERRGRGPVPSTRTGAEARHDERAGDPHDASAPPLTLRRWRCRTVTGAGRGPRNRESDEHRDARAAFYRILVKYTITSDKNLL